MRIAVMAGLVAVVALSACGRSDREPRLLNLRAAGEGPDEFAILPTRPLEQPEDYAVLPPPTPSGINRTDPTPEADLAVALGGRAEALARGGVDGGIVTYASRFGVAPDIRAQLAAEDLEFRRRNDGRILERLFSVNVYYRAYRDQSLDQYRELERFRAAGVRTPAVPPDPVLQDR
jgi:hypothetical protein